MKDILKEKTKDQPFIVVMLMVAVMVLSSVVVHLWLDNKKLTQQIIEILQNIPEKDIDNLLDMEVINQDQLNF